MPLLISTSLFPAPAFEPAVADVREMTCTLVRRP